MNMKFTQAFADALTNLRLTTEGLSGPDFGRSSAVMALKRVLSLANEPYDVFDPAVAMPMYFTEDMTRAVIEAKKAVNDHDCGNKLTVPHINTLRAIVIASKDAYMTAPPPWAVGPIVAPPPPEPPKGWLYTVNATVELSASFEGGIPNRPLELARMQVAAMLEKVDARLMADLNIKTLTVKRLEDVK